MAEEEVHAVLMTIPIRNLVYYLTGQRILKLPDGAMITSVWREEFMIDDGTNAYSLLWLRVEHESFPVVTPGMKITRMKARYRLPEHIKKP